MELEIVGRTFGFKFSIFDGMFGLKMIDVSFGVQNCVSNLYTSVK